MQTLTSEQRGYFERAATQYHSDLMGDTSVLAYLAQRGFGPGVVRTFRLGAVHRPLVGHEGFAGRLAMPYITPGGVVNMRFRCLKSHDHKAVGCPKILPMTGMQQTLYNVGDLKKPGRAIAVVEGESDTWTLSALCGIPTVGLPGAKSWKKHFGRCLEDFDLIYSVGDGDKAGGELNSFLAREARARPIRLPRGEDVSSLYQKGGRDAVLTLFTG